MSYIPRQAGDPGAERHGIWSTAESSSVLELITLDHCSRLELLSSLEGKVYQMDPGHNPPLEGPVDFESEFKAAADASTAL
jgi:hypothetical protein